MDNDTNPMHVLATLSIPLPFLVGGGDDGLQDCELPTE